MHFYTRPTTWMHNDQRVFRTLNKTIVQLAVSYPPRLNTVLSNTKQSQQIQTLTVDSRRVHLMSVSAQRRQPGWTDPSQQSDQDEHQHVRTTPQDWGAPHLHNNLPPFTKPPPPLVVFHLGERHFNKRLCNFWNDLCCPRLAKWGDSVFFFFS